MFDTTKTRMTMTELMCGAKKLSLCVKPFSVNTGTQRTDGQTDGRTDRMI